MEYKNFTFSRSNSIDTNLRSFMVKVYGIMALGLLVSAVSSVIVASSPSLIYAVLVSPLKWVILFSPMLLAMWISARINQMAPSTAALLFTIFSMVTGFSLSSLFLIYRVSSIASIFLSTAAMFGSMSIYGYATKKDLSSMGSFLMMGLLGVFISGLVNIFLQSSILRLVLNIVTVVVCTGLTAYETQQIKLIYDSRESQEVSQKKAVLGALSLYINFINIFVSLMQLFGEKRQ